MEQERTTFDDGGLQLTVPQYIKEIIAEVSALARKSPDINQRSGVSVRVSIANYENVISNALRRAIRLGEEHVVPRMSDLPAIIASTAGKIELESIEDGREEQIIERLLMNAVARTFNRYFEVQQFESLIQRFRGGLKVDVGELMPSAHYVKLMRELDGMLEGVARLGAYDSPASIASAVEFILEGLHVNKRLNKEKLSGKVVYRS